MNGAVPATGLGASRGAKSAPRDSVIHEGQYRRWIDFSLEPDDLDPETEVAFRAASLGIHAHDQVADACLAQESNDLYEDRRGERGLRR